MDHLFFQTNLKLPGPLPYSSWLKEPFTRKINNMWETLWTILFFLSISIFALMSVWVSIGGFRDLKRLFQRLNEDITSDDRD